MLAHLKQTNKKTLYMPPRCVDCISYSNQQVRKFNGSPKSDLLELQICSPTCQIHHNDQLKALFDHKHIHVHTQWLLLVELH